MLGSTSTITLHLMYMARRMSQLEYARALQRSRREEMTEPRAEDAHYDRKSRHMRRGESERMTCAWFR